MPSAGLVNPDVIRAFQNDPKNRLANSMLTAGTSGAPVAAGKYAWGEGAARAVQAIAGAFLERSLQKKYHADQDEVSNLLANAFSQQVPNAVPPGFGDGANPAVDNSAVQGAAVAGATPPAPDVQQVPLPASTAAPDAEPVRSPRMAEIAASLGAPPPAPQDAPAPVSGASRPLLAPPPKAGFSWSRPLADLTPTSGFGQRGAEFHNGQDYAGDIGDAVHPIGPGVVIEAGKNGASGNYVKIQHPNGYVSGYAHLSAYNVKPGDAVDATQAIGAVGNTGHVVASAGGDGAHLHLTVRDPHGNLLNPASIKYGQFTSSPATNNTATAGAAMAGVNQPMQQAAMPAPAPPPPLPMAPPMPQAPQPVAAPTSSRANAGRYLLQSGNPYVTAQGMQLADAGMGEEFQAASQASQQQFQTGQTGYQAGLNNYNAAQGSARDYAYGANRDATQFGNQMFQQRDQQAYGHNERLGGQDFQHGERVSTQDFTLQRDAKQHDYHSQDLAYERGTQFTLQDKQDAGAMARTVYATDGGGKHGKKGESADDLKGPERKAWLDDNTTLSQWGAAYNELDRFKKLNAQTSTGMIAGHIPTAFNQNLAQLHQIQEKLVPLTSQQLKGNFSDKDAAMARSAGPQITNSRGANDAIVDDLRSQYARMADAVRTKWDYRFSGRQSQYMNDWQAYVNSVPYKSGMTFRQWLAQRPVIKAGGK